MMNDSKRSGLLFAVIVSFALGTMVGVIAKETTKKDESAVSAYWQGCHDGIDNEVNRQFVEQFE